MLRKCVLAAGALLALGSVAEAAPLEVYGKLPGIERAEISPSGAYTAFVVTDGEKRTIAVQSTADHKVLATIPTGTVKIRALDWAGDQHLLVTSSTPANLWILTGGLHEFFMVQDVDLKSGRAAPLMNRTSTAHNLHSSMNVVSAPPEVRTIQGKPVVFVHGVNFVGDQGQSGLFRIELDGDRRAVRVEGGGNGAYDWVIDPQGRAVAQASYDDGPGVWKLMLRGADGGWRTVQTIPAPIDQPALGGFGRGADSILVGADDGKTGSSWREAAMPSGAWGERAPIGDGHDAIHDPTTGRLIGEHVLADDRPTYTFFDPRDDAAWRLVTKAFAGDLVTLQSWSDDRRKIIVRVDSPEMGPAYAIIDLDKGAAEWIGPEYTSMKPEDVSPVRAVRYKASDGLEIPGYLTLPRGRDPHALPLVVLAHGGPAARDMPGFDWWAQALASRGYAVLQANFRGSDGFGRNFLAAGFGQWGRKMQTDLSDGVRDLVRQGIVDPKRVCIVGASYGGYAALAGATIDHGVYRCAVSVAGVADLRALATDFRAKDGRDAERYWLRFIGAQNTADPVLARYSPAARAAEADMPILLIHGRDDTVVPFSQSVRMADALRAAGKPVELVQLPGEDHWLTTGATRLQMLQAAVAFLEKNNPPN